MERPEKPTPEQYAQLESAGQLKMDGAPEWVTLENRKYGMQMELPRQGLALIRVIW